MIAGYSLCPGLAKRDILFIHGNLASARWWTPTFTEWARQGSLGAGRLIALNLPGCGDQPDWPKHREFDLKTLAEGVLCQMNDLQMECIDIVGHSLGGLIALQMMILAPHRINKCFLLSTVGATGMVFEDGMFNVFEQMGANPEIARTVILSTVYRPERLSEDLKDRLSADAFKAVRGMGPAILRLLKSVDLRNALTACLHPTLIVHGQEDLIIPRTDSERLVEILPNARLEVLTDVGHCWNVEDAVAFTDRLRRWF